MNDDVFLSKLHWVASDGRLFPYDEYANIEKPSDNPAWAHMKCLPLDGYPYTVEGYAIASPVTFFGWPEVPRWEDVGDEVVLNKRQYQMLITKSMAFDAQVECFRRVRNALETDDKVEAKPWYEMLAICVERMSKELKRLRK